MHFTMVKYIFGKIPNMYFAMFNSTQLIRQHDCVLSVLNARRGRSLKKKNVIQARQLTKRSQLTSSVFHRSAWNTPEHEIHITVDLVGVQWYYIEHGGI